MLRQSDYEKLTDTVLATHLLRDNSKSIVEVARQTHDIRVSDLVLGETESLINKGCTV
jgi:hypothetical protein